MRCAIGTVAVILNTQEFKVGGGTQEGGKVFQKKDFQVCLRSVEGNPKQRWGVKRGTLTSSCEKPPEAQEEVKEAAGGGVGGGGVGAQARFFFALGWVPCQTRSRAEVRLWSGRGLHS